ncbi:methyltransferase domain-containing protein, partial [bacterium]|nr:methyltransferase domain-containing protein [bacterium]
ISSDGKRIAAVEFSENRICKIVILSLEKDFLGKYATKIIKSIQMPENSFDPRKKFGWSIAEPLKNNGFKKDLIKNCISELLVKVGLSPNYAERFPHEVSGGECQRIAIARAIAINPKLLICDEATSALDVTVQGQITQLIRKLCKTENIACLFITHDLSILPKISDRVIVMYGGKIVEEGAVSDIINTPKSIYTKKLMSADFFKKAEINSRIEKYWDRRSSDFSRVRRLELNGVDSSAWLDIIQKHLPQKEHLNILDVGTGAGFFAILLSKCGHSVTGIDMSSAMLEEAKKNAVEFGISAEFKKMNAQNLDFKDSTFDVVISRNLTWTLPDAMQAYREWYRVLKTGGILLNFDSDYGDITFTKKDDKANVHSNIDDELFDECNNIKDNLRISSHRRPNWDVEYLQKLGFDVKFDEDISSIVHKDKNCHYDSVPLFAIYGVKK